MENPQPPRSGVQRAIDDELEDEYPVPERTTPAVAKVMVQDRDIEFVGTSLAGWANEFAEPNE